MREIKDKLLHLCSCSTWGPSIVDCSCGFRGVLLHFYLFYLLLLLFSWAPGAADILIFYFLFSSGFATISFSARSLRQNILACRFAFALLFSSWESRSFNHPLESHSGPFLSSLVTVSLHTPWIKKPRVTSVFIDVSVITQRLISVTIRYRWASWRTKIAMRI